MIFLEKLFFYLLIFSVPIETRLILARWTEPFNEWTAGYIYWTDILLAAVLIFWLARNLKTAKIFNFAYSAEAASAAKAGQSSIFRGVKSFKSRILNPNFFLFLFFVVSALSIANSRLIGLSLYQLLKLAEFIGFYFYLRSALGRGKIFKLEGALAVIIISGVFQAAIAIFQYLKQSGLGLKLLGESPLSVNTTGVAVFIADGMKYLRAYGTTPHPNVLAAWLMLAIFSFYFLLFYYLKPQEIKAAALNHNSSLIRREDLRWIAIYLILLFGFFFTFSRVVIFLWALGAVISGLLFFREKFNGFLAGIKRRLVVVAITTLIAVSFFTVFFWPQVKSRILISAGEEAVTQRIFYNKIAESVAASNPLLGIGIGQFVPRLMTKLKHWPSYFYQPVHNIYLLIASETGFIGLTLFLMFLFFILYNFGYLSRFQEPYHFSFFILALSFILIGLFDHFLWTLQQGGLIFWMVLAFVSLNSNPGRS
jgi:O-antigen ligase